jgi:diacylglycerol O-acyltransferase
MDSFMRDSDAFSWYMERDPVLRSTVVAVAWLERCPDWDVLCAKVDQATRLVPLFRMRVLEPPGRLTAPRWTVDDDFDLSWHLRRVKAPDPGSPQAVLGVARHEAMDAFDRSRPLWEFTLVEGAGAGRAALVMKLHHSLTDGLGGMELALLLFDTNKDASAPVTLPEAPAAEAFDTSDLVRERVAWELKRFTGFVGSRARSAVPSAMQAARHPLTSASDALETARSIGRTVAPVLRRLSPVMTGRGLRRHLDMVEVGLDDLKTASATAGGTLNDGFMAAVVGGFRRYHEHHGTHVDALRVTLPISIRTPDDPMGGNRITLIRFVVPVSDPDPARRIAAIHEGCLTARSERSLPFTNSIAATLNLLPAGVVGSMLKNVDFVASDVPGFPFPVYLAGAALERYVAFGPTIGSSANMTLLSYNGTCCIGVTLDEAAIPDHELFVECLRGGFEEVMDVGGKHSPPRLPVAARPGDFRTKGVGRAACDVGPRATGDFVSVRP